MKRYTNIFMCSAGFPGAALVAGCCGGVKAGSASSAAAFGGKTGSATLTVSQATLASLAVTPAATTSPAGATRQLAAFATYSDGSVIDVTTSTGFVSASPALVAVHSTGLMTYVVAGSSTITLLNGRVLSAAAVTLSNNQITK